MAGGNFGLTPEDMAQYKEYQKLATPIVSPWLSLGAGALMGLYAQNQQSKQYNRDKKLAATTARLRPWTGLTPNMNLQRPSAVANVLGGIGGAMGTAKSINAYSTALNLQEQMKAAQEAKAAEVARIAAMPYGPLASEPGFNPQWGAETAMPYAYGQGFPGEGPQQPPPGWLMEAMGMVPPAQPEQAMYQQKYEQSLR